MEAFTMDRAVGCRIPAPQARLADGRRARTSSNPSECKEIFVTAHATARQPAASLHALLERVGRRYFADSPLSIGDRGAVVAQFYRSRITSAFQPVVRARDAAVAGHHALLRVESATGESIAPWSLFAQALEDAALVRLDRLCRTVHALNYFPTGDPGARLFLNIEQRLLTGVAADHGAYFEAILALIGVAPERVVIVMPPGATDNPVAFVRAAISYRIRGYRVMVPVRSLADAELSHVFLAEPHYVAIDGPEALAGTEARGFLQALAQRGTHLVARGVETDGHRDLALAHGVEFLQGFHVGRP
jgi:EAL domain-containing protein (putative c-di-GMP-specific phosphodiesterase class I)